ncbi:MAG TPA: hypothetical protein VGX76_19980, partial [Pirellulales bacterium]|nr:hypothetical protein [Pirellulales bacterium]
MLAVNPLQRPPHRNLAMAADRTGNDVLAIDANRALLLLEPIDPAEIHFRLASLLHHTGDLEGAKRHALEALEEAPRYREAHRKLLEIVRDIAKRDGKSELEAKGEQGAKGGAEPSDSSRTMEEKP